MTPTEFTLALAGTRMSRTGRAAQAARRVLVHEPGVPRLTYREAARLHGIQLSAVQAAVRRLRPTLPCPRCDGTGRVSAHP